MIRLVAPFVFLLALAAALAFWPLYLSQSWLLIDGYTHLHAMLGALWLLILLVQPLLIINGYKLAHRAVGRVAFWVAFAFVLSSFLLAHFRVSRLSDDEFAQNHIFTYLPIVVGFLFALACFLGYRWRQSTAVHSRFMVDTGLLIIDPELARILFFYLPPLPFEALYRAIPFGLLALAMFFLVRSIPARVKGRACFRNYCGLTVVCLVLFFVIPYTAAWMDFVLWFKALPLT